MASQSQHTCASIVVPLHNCAQRLPSIVASLQAQTLDDFQAVLVDDGSTDGSFAAAQKAAACDARIHVIGQRNAGPGAARNAGMDAACGIYLAFMDADDTLDPNFLAHMVARAEQTQADVTICQTLHANVQTEELYPSPAAWDPSAYPAVFDPSQYAERLFGDFRNWPWDKLFKRSFLAQHKIRFPALYRSEDLAFTCSALAAARRIALVDEALYTYTVADTGSSTYTRDTHALDFLESCRALKDFLDAEGLTAQFKDSYVQWVSLACMLNLVELNGMEAFWQVYRALHEGGLASLGLESPRSVLEQRAEEYAAEPTTNGSVDDVLSIVERHGPAAGLLRLLAHKHCGQLLKPVWFRAWQNKRRLENLKRYLREQEAAGLSESAQGAGGAS